MPCGPLHSARRNYFSIRLEKNIVGRKRVLKPRNEHICYEVTRSHAKSRGVTRSHAESREIPWMYSFFEYIHRNVSWILHTFTETVTRSHAKSRRVPNHCPTNPNNVNVLSVGKRGCHHQTPQLKPQNPSNWCANSCTDNNRLTQGFRKSWPSNELSHQLCNCLCWTKMSMIYVYS